MQFSSANDSVLYYNDHVIEKGKSIKYHKNKENIASMVSHTSHRTVITITITQFVTLIYTNRRSKENRIQLGV